MRIPRGQQHDIKVANGEEHYTPAMSEWDDELSKCLLLLGSTTGVRRERESRYGALHGVAESKQASVVRRIACKLPLDEVLKTLNGVISASEPLHHGRRSRPLPRRS